MKKLSIKEFHSFMRGTFKVSIERAYRNHRIFCEADLQSIAWHKIQIFLERHEETKDKFRVLNKPYLKDSHTYPDLVVFKRQSPWVVIELKEGRRLRKATAEKELEKLLQAKRVLSPKRGYLVYVARYGERRAIVGPKGEGGRYFFEVPVILKEGMSEEQLDEWTEGFRPWARYRVVKKDSIGR